MLNKEITIDEIVQKWLPILGIIFVVSGLSYLFYDGFWDKISETGRLMLGFMAGTVAIASGFTFEKKLKYFADVVMGGGVLMLYITLIYGSRFESAEQALIPELNTLVIAALFAFAVVFYSLQRKSKVILFLGLLGGYLTPFFMGQAGTFDYSLPLEAYLMYFVSINVAVLIVSSKLFLKGIGLLNAIGLFAGTIALSAVSSIGFADIPEFTSIFAVVILALHIATTVINSRKFSTEYDPFLVSGYVLPLVWFTIVINGFLVNVIPSVSQSGLFGIASVVYFTGWYSLRNYTDSERHYALYFNGVASVILAFLALNEHLKEFDGLLLTASSLVFAGLYAAKPLPQRMVTYLGLAAFGVFLTASHMVVSDYPGNLFFLDKGHLMLILSFVPFFVSYGLPKCKEAGLMVFQSIARTIALIISVLLIISDLIVNLELPGDFVFFTVPALILAFIANTQSTNEGEGHQTITWSTILGIIGYTTTYFVTMGRIYPAPMDILPFAESESYIGLFTVITFALLLRQVKKRHDELPKGLCFSIVFTFYTSLFLAVSHELLLFFNLFSEIGTTEGIRALALTLWWALLACYMIFHGTRTESFAYVKNLGFALLVFTILKILVYDLGHVDRNLKVILFVVVGLLILALSYYANRRGTPQSEEMQSDKQ